MKIEDLLLNEEIKSLKEKKYKRKQKMFEANRRDPTSADFENAPWASALSRIVQMIAGRILENKAARESQGNKARILEHLRRRKGEYDERREQELNYARNLMELKERKKDEKEQWTRNYKERKDKRLDSYKADKLALSRLAIAAKAMKAEAMEKEKDLKFYMKDMSPSDKLKLKGNPKLLAKINANDSKYKLLGKIPHDSSRFSLLSTKNYPFSIREEEKNARGRKRV